MNIQFSPLILYALPIYLDTSWQDLIESTNFKYSKMLIYNSIKRKCKISHSLNSELNKLYFEELKLTMEDLNNLYQLSELIEVGQIKYKNYNHKGER